VVAQQQQQQQKLLLHQVALTSVQKEQNINEKASLWAALDNFSGLLGTRK